MYNQTKTRFLFYTFILFVCLNAFFLRDTAAQEVNITPVAAPEDANYTFESIDVEGVEFLALTASNHFGAYAGYTRHPDSEKEIAFTIIDGVFTTYDFPGSQNTHFYALGNSGVAAGYYVDSDGLHHGVILEDGELRQYDFPDAVQTEIYGISDATGAMTGNFIDAQGIRRGFSGETIIEAPGATETFADFVNTQGVVSGSYVDAEGKYKPYALLPTGDFITAEFAIDTESSGMANMEYFFLHGLTETLVAVARGKAVGDVPRTYVGQLGVLHEVQFPGSVSTEGWNINRDESVVGYYDTADGRRHGFHARPVSDDDPGAASAGLTYTFESIDVPGVDFLELTASSDFDDYAGNTKSEDGEKIVGFTLIDGVFKTYDFPGSKNTYFYALGNNGNAAGHYEDADGLFHGVVLEDGELRQYDFPGAVQTFLRGISDATGALTGDFIDASGVRRGFSGEIGVEVPGALETYADFINADGVMVGSYVDADGIYYPYIRIPNGEFVTLPGSPHLEYFFVHGINDAGLLVFRYKAVGDAPLTAVGTFAKQTELQFPGSVSTEGWNVNQDGSIVGNYVSADGRRHGFIARPAADTAPPVDPEPVEPPADADYTFETIDVPGVDFLALTASSDFEDYAGYTPSPDGEKMVAFTLIDGVFTTYDFPDAQETRFYALGNNGDAAGYYVDSDGHRRGVVLRNGELQQFDFPNAVQTEIYGISDATGALTGNFIDDSGIRRGFSADIIVEYPGAVETYADFVNSRGLMVGSYIDVDGVYHAYARLPDGRFVPINLENASTLEYFFVHGINDAGTIVARAKRMGAVPLTYIGSAHEGLKEFKLPGSVSTEGYNINQDGSIVGNYESADGRTHGFIARPAGDDQPVDQPTLLTYTFESIDVPGVDFLAVTASSDFEDYAGYTKSADGGKDSAFTLIDGVFTTYDFPGSKNTYFYALGNNGNAAGYYEDSNGLHRGVVLANGELRQYDFPNAVQTEIYGISDATGALTGNFIDASGVRRGFSGETIIEAPGASATYADFVNASGRIVGGYIDADGIPHAYVRTPDDRFTTIDVENAAAQEYLFLHGFSDAGIFVGRAKAMDGAPRTFVGTAIHGLQELHFPGSISTNGWNINQNSSVVGYYDTPDGRRHGFIARSASQAEAESYNNAYTVTLSKGLNMISVPLAPPTPMNARSLAGLTGATTVITLDAANQQFVGWTPDAPDDGFSIEGGQGYIVNVPETRQFAFVGAPWTTQTADTAAAPAISVETPQAQEAWAFVVTGHLEGKPAFDGYQVMVRNLRTDSIITASVQGDYFAAANADLARRSIVQVGDVMEVRVIGPNGNVESDTFSYKVTPESIANAVLSIRLDSIGKPKLTQLLQNYPNPFNPETWIPYQLETSANVTLQIYDTTGSIVRTIDLGFKGQGFYMTRSRAAYWDGRNNMGEQVASGVYFYSLQTPEFSATRKMLILK